MLKTTLTALVGIYLLDLTGFCLWVMSGQIPPDGFYVGAITANIIKLIF